jgi:hypothetical protein
MMLLVILLVVFTQSGEGVAESPAPATQPAATQPTSQPSGGKVLKGEEQLLAILQQRDPASYRAVLKLKETDPAEYRRFVGQVSSWMEGKKDLAPEVVEANKTLQETRVKLWRLGQLIHEMAPKKVKPRFIEEIRQAVERQFDAELVLLQYRIKHLRGDIDRIEKKVQERSSQRDKCIQERVEQILHPTTQPASQKAPDKDLKLR